MDVLKTSHTRWWAAFLPFILLSGILVNWAFLAGVVFAAPLAGSSQPGHNTFQQFEQLAQQSVARQKPFQRPGSDPYALTPQKNAKMNKPLPGVEPATMHDLNYTLDSSFVLHPPRMAALTRPAKVQGMAIPAGTGPLIARGNDGRLEVDVPRGSLDFSHATLASGGEPVGHLLLQIHQISGHYIEADSILGTYQIQVVDSLGNVVQGVSLHQPITIIYHYQDWEMQDLNLNPNEIHLAWTGQLTQAEAAKQSTTGLVIPMTNNAQAHMLTAQSTVLDGMLTASGTPEIEAPAHPDLFEASGNDGQYTYSYPLAVAPGPDGFAPQLELDYSSQSTNERYSPRAPAGDEGDGFSLSLGSITAAQYPASSTGGAATWYSINGVDGVSDKLVPMPNKSGYYETEHISHLLIQYTGTCWRVWDTDGSYETLGCTSDSVQKDSTGTAYEWDVNQILAPYNNSSQVKMILVSYLQDTMASLNNEVRDSAIKQIQYGYATSTSATSLSLVAGTVDFHYYLPNAASSLSPFAVPYPSSYYSACKPPTITNYRCDDPGTYNSISSPDVMSTMTLNSLTSYVGSDTTGNPAYSYAFTYQDTPYTTNYYDPYTQIQQAAAGEHLLTQITPTVYVNGAAFQRKSVVFSYATALHDSYYDASAKTESGNNQFSGQTFWSYLDHYEDLETGEGANISYATAYGNMTGTPYTTDSNGNVTDDRFDPLYCTNNANNSDTSKRCTGTYGHPDEDSWSLQVVTAVSALGTDSSGNPTVATTTYQYALQQVSPSNLPAGCNPITGSGVPAQEADCVADNWVPGYNGVVQHDGDWQDYYHAELRGFNIVYITSPSGDLTVDYYFASEGWWNPESNGTNYNAGQMYQQDIYQQDAETPAALLQETDNYYTGVSAGYSSVNSCDGNANEIYAPCVVAPMETKTITYDGQGGSSNAPWIDTKYTYDDLNATQGYTYSGYHNTLQEVISSSNAPTITRKWTYSPNNGTDSQGIFYYDVDKVTHSEIDDASGHVWQCEDTTYDEGVASGVTTPAAGWPTTTTDYSTCGNASTAVTSYTAYDQYGNTVGTVDALGAANPSWYTSSGCSVSSSDPVAYQSASWTAGHYTSCTAYDATHTAGLPVTDTNALGQSTSTNYDYTSGAQPTSTVDLNHQTTSYSYSYDSSGNETINTSEPGESGSYTTRQVENSACTTSSTLPCYEIDTNNSLYPGAVTQTFYDSQGRQVETISPGPTPGDDTLVITIYNDQSHEVWTSEPFEIAAGSYGSGYIDPSSVNALGNSPVAGTTTFYDALGRVIATQDLNYGSSQEPGQSCSSRYGTYTTCTNYTIGQAVGDSTYYEETSTIDPNGHVKQSFTDAQGNVRYTQTTSGVYTGTLTVQQQTQTQYNALNKPTSVSVIDEQPQSGQSLAGVTTTMTYDDMGRLLTETDPDQGTFTYSYDPDGNILSVVQTSGSNSRTLGYNYDLLSRMTCEQTAAPTINMTGACSAGSPLIQNTYDTTFLGVQGTTDFPVGHLTRSVATTYYPDGTAASATEQYQTDARGQTVTTQMQLSLPSSWNVGNTLPTYQMTQAYNDADQVTTTTANAVNATYSLTQVYDPTNGVLQGLSNNGNSTANLAQLSYNVYTQLSGITLLNGASSSPASLASEAFSYDGDLRPTGLTASWLPGSGNSGQILAQGRTYDNAGNVTGVNTTFAAVPGQGNSGGAETQNFCYDEQNRLVWAGNGGTQPGAGNGTCGSGTLSSGLAGAGYTATYAYTNLGQIWQGSVNGQGQAEQYLYCNSQPHEVSGIYPTGTTCATRGSVAAVYTAGWGVYGNQNYRSYNGVTAQLSYDALNHLVEYSASNGQEFYVYDAQGERVLTRSTSAGITTLTAYPFGLQELTYSGGGTYQSQIDYYTIAGHLIGWSNGTSTTYDLTDALGSVVLSFSASAIQGEQLYGPYGNQRYIEGMLGTDKGYTGQFVDAVTGLDYYNARWYDPVSGRFLSPDSVQGNMLGFDPYAYVSCNPETMNDPTGLWGWGDTFAAIGSVVAVAAIVTVVAIAAPVAVAAVAAVAAGTSVDLGATAVAAAGLTVAADTGAITGVAAGGAIDLGLTSGTIAAAGEAQLAVSNWNNDVSGQEIWNTASAYGFSSAYGGWIGDGLAGFIPGGCWGSLASLVVRKGSAAIAGFAGYEALQTAPTSYAAALSTDQLAAIQEKDPARKAMEARQAREHAAFLKRLRANQQRDIQSIQSRYQSNWRAYYDYAVFEAAVAAGAADNGAPVRFGRMNIS